MTLIRKYSRTHKTDQRIIKPINEYDRFYRIVQYHTPTHASGSILVYQIYMVSAQIITESWNSTISSKYNWIRESIFREMWESMLKYINIFTVCWRIDK